MFELTGKKILVVGASSGIGAAAARALSQLGAFVILAARREEKLAALSAEIGEERALYRVLDVCDNGSIAPFFDEVVDLCGKLNGMVYTAGIVDDTPLRFIDHDRLLKTFEVNYFGFVECVRQFCVKKRYDPGARIVSVSSVASVIGEKAHTVYSASKAAMDATVRCLAKELAGKGIALNTVQPGMISTDMTDGFLTKNGEQSEGYIRTMQRQYLGMGQPEEVAALISFLMSSEARMLTGLSIPIDGGSVSS